MAKVKTVNISNSVIHLLHRASQFADHQFEQATAAHGLTVHQLVVLDAIAKLDDPSQTDVCDVTGIDRSALADMVRRLCARRLVGRRRNRADARAYTLKLTDDGIACLENLLPTMFEAEQKVTGVLSESRRRDFIDLLHSILAPSFAAPTRKLART
jgi:DNA-binding MarR family transcriptional regulator